MNKQKIEKRYDDYLPGETRAAYVDRRAVRQVSTVPAYWPFNKTLARPSTREFRRLEQMPQMMNHIKIINSKFQSAANSN